MWWGLAEESEQPLPVFCTLANTFRRTRRAHHPTPASGFPSRPARSWVNCQAVRPEREPRVVAHSSAWASISLRGRLEAVVFRVAVDHGEIVVLAAMVEAEPEAEAVGERHFFLDRLARIDRASALVLHHFARHEVAAVRGRVEEDVRRPPLDAAFERRLERLVGRVAGVERQVVAEDDEVEGRLAQ